MPHLLNTKVVDAIKQGDVTWLHMLMLINNHGFPCIHVMFYCVVFTPKTTMAMTNEMIICLLGPILLSCSDVVQRVWNCVCALRRSFDFPPMV